jgi:hypothetical protein
MENKDAVIALTMVLFCWLLFISKLNSIRLIVHPDYRNLGLAKKKGICYSLKKYPNAKVFGITTGLTVKINSELGYKPVPFLN